MDRAEIGEWTYRYDDDEPEEWTDPDGVTYYGPFNTRDARADGYADGVKLRYYRKAFNDDVAYEHALDYCEGSDVVRLFYYRGIVDGWKGD